MSLYNEKKLEHKSKQDNGKSFGKSFNYETGRKKAMQMALGKAKGDSFRKKNNY